MLQEPMMQKLLAMRLHGMVDALKAQEQDTETRELSFLERLALLVDHQWNWRQNQALARRLYAAKLRGNTCVEDIDFRASRGLDKSVIRALAQESAWARNHEHLRSRPDWCGKEFRGLRPGSESLPGWILGAVYPSCGAVSRSGYRSSGR